MRNNPMIWSSLVGLTLTLAGCPGGDDGGDSTTASTVGQTTSATGADADGTAADTTPATDDGMAESTDDGMPATDDGMPATDDGMVDCDPACAPGQMCVAGSCIGEIDCVPECGAEEACVDGMCVSTTSDYGPCNACAAGEMAVSIMGIEGCFCSPGCDGAMSMCPMPNEGTAVGACALGAGMTPTQCALVCDPTMKGMCPTGATCQDTGMMGVGVCTHPAG